jgi:hypothetical protein
MKIVFFLEKTVTGLVDMLLLDDVKYIQVAIN